MDTARKPKYLTVFVALAALTIAEVAVAFTAATTTARVVLLLVMALAKASLVALYYMHLRYEGPILRAIAAFPILLIIVLLVLPTFDLGLAR